MHISLPGTQRFVIVGSGQAGGWAAKTLREQGFTGSVAIVGQEPHPPYERPPLSKQLLVSAKPVATSYLWQPEKLNELGIERDCALVVAIERSKRELVLGDGRRLGYDKLLLATGARPRRLIRPGTNLSGIHYLRTVEDCLKIRGDLAKAEKLLVVGGGWIGLEVAAAAIALGVSVTLVEAMDQLCGRSLPKQTASYFLDLHRTRGVDVRLNTKLVSFEGVDTVERATFEDGSSLPVSLVIIGVGAEPNVEIAAESGLVVDNGIVVDEMTRTSDPNIFAAGDVTSHPVGRTGERLRLESWQNAQNQGIAAAKAMLGQEAPYRELPWFWSDQFDLNFQMLGIPSSSDKIFVKGDPEGGRFIQFFVADQRINAVAAFNSAKDLREAKKIMLGNLPFDAPVGAKVVQ